MVTTTVNNQDTTEYTTDKCPGNHNETECAKQLLPVRDALDMLNGKWKIPIIIALTYGNCRFKELHRQIGITPKMLSKELKELEMHQLVKRTVYDSTPVSVTYELTPYATSLKPVISALRKWGTEHRNRLMGKNQ
jgi:DNA-binding HxlR family transcriptional regulator